MKHCRAILSLLVVTLCAGCSQPPADGPGDPWTGSSSDDGGAPAGWTLTWSDEFDGPEGSSLDPAKWTFDVGGDGWGNKELEYYTDGDTNAQVSGGYLTIRAQQAVAGSGQPLDCWYGPCQFTSARINTLGKFSQQYGHFEARIQIPSGQGMWPAFWLLGEDLSRGVSWPACGEVDIMENAGATPAINHGSLHATGDATMTATFTSQASLADGFHLYAIDWNETGIWFSVDGQVYESQFAADYSSAGWPFNQPFFIIINVAVGGTFDGAPDGATTFPQSMVIDYVRVYQQAQ
jgi:beta-glucanase (GH16 family)